MGRFKVDRDWERMSILLMNELYNKIRKELNAWSSRLGTSRDSARATAELQPPDQGSACPAKIKQEGSRNVEVGSDEISVSYCMVITLLQSTQFNFKVILFST